MPKIYSSIACNLDNHLLSAALPLFAEESVEAIEWSFDTLYKQRNIPDWFIELLTAFGQENRLVGHGVYFSLFSGKWTPEQEAWLQQLEKVSGHFQFDHISEHFGFMTGANFHAGAPIGIPFTRRTLQLGQDRLQRIFQACRCPVGLENLAFAYSLDEVKAHGQFLDELLEPVNGFIILDLHNLYCQLQNFTIPFEALLELYPLHRVREIHISGGSWEDSALHPRQKIRRDTHDDAVPDEVFQMLSAVVPRCPHLKFVVLEQLGIGLHTPASQEAFREDFRKLKRTVQSLSTPPPETVANDFLPKELCPLGPAPEDLSLHRQQQQLSRILETAPDLSAAREELQSSDLAGSAWKVEEWEPAMLETAMQIAQKWKNGFA
ncbi:multinuclear nonheme iron-dependent oxidase [Flavilitoribacter nigricans]|uniref:DUF692 family protein n=1 Tax=Flavilitoribacter nigricans (strain ATCC 23147 / DSM 23189 / NBRC 102662 / NCIMB 1420 / SS-2) TaxID=1122177 RepID=A0A2D0NGL0_FLAN2|nr:DUF692 family multinuclear iron-containing protein [Flavilitoribacter nigricans]PHN07644.1 hypothetical protein CRP01_05970 [Flavilitoribacter nigricans DSM 23189 = NBRC 102662]